MKNTERRERKDVKNVELRITPKKTADDPAYDDDLFDANDFDSVYASPGRGASDQTEDGMIYVGLGNIPVKKDAGEAAVRYTYSEIDSEASETDGKSGAESMLHILPEKAPEMSERTETAEYIESSESFEPSKIKQHPEIRTEPSVRESKRSYSVKVTDKKVKTAVKMRRAKKGISVSDAPFITCGESAWRITLDIIVAMLPSLIWAVYVFGPRIITVTAISVISCFLSELWFEYLVRRRVTVGDLSAVAEGIMLALLMPASVPLWIPVVAGFFGIVFAKCLFGGQGRNIFKPSLAGFAFVSIVLRSFVDGFYTEPMARLLPFSLSSAVQGVSYPLSNVCGEVLPMYSYGEMFMGVRPGAIGEISVLMILLGAAYLIFRHIISWHIPVCFVLSCAVIFSVFSLYPGNRFMMTEVFCSLIPLCAVFFASDLSSSPVFSFGKLIFGIGCGIATAILRYSGVGIYSPVYAVLIMELFSRPLDFLSALILRIGLPRGKRNRSCVEPEV